jgi:hypothetical protein
MPDANLIIGVTYDDKGRAALIASNERAFKQSSSRMAAHEQQVRRGSAFSGGQNAAYRVGMVSQQAQDVAVSLQMGMSASRVIAQQGSQIASIFGTKGMIIGGVIAIGAAIYEWAANTKAAEKAAEEYKKVLDETAEIAKKNDAGRIEMAAKIAAAARGEEAGTRVAEELKYEKELNEIHQKEIALVAKLSQDKEKARKESVSWAGRFSRLSVAREAEALAASGIGRALSGEESQLRELAERKKQMAEEINIDRATRNKKKEAAIDFSVWSTNQQAAMLAIESEEERKYAQLEHDFKSDLFRIEMSEESDAQKMKRIYAAENLYAAKLEAAEREKASPKFFDSESVKIRAEAIKNEDKLRENGVSNAEELLSISKEIGRLNTERLSAGMTDRRADEIRLELSNLEIKRSSALKGASEDIVKKANEEYELASAMNAITMNTNATKLQVLKAEKDLLDKKIAWTPNEIALLNAQKRKLDEDIRKQQRDGLIAAGGAGMGVVAQQRAADRAEERALKRAQGNLGLGQIKRGMSGEIIGGVNLDPNAGKIGEQVGKEEIARRQKLLGVIANKGNLPVPMEAVFDKQQIKDLADGIALAILATTTK